MWSATITSGCTSTCAGTRRHRPPSKWTQGMRAAIRVALNRSAWLCTMSATATWNRCTAGCWPTECGSTRWRARPSQAHSRMPGRRSAQRSGIPSRRQHRSGLHRTTRPPTKWSTTNNWKSKNPPGPYRTCNFKPGRQSLLAKHFGSQYLSVWLQSVAPTVMICKLYWITLLLRICFPHNYILRGCARKCVAVWINI